MSASILDSLQQLRGLDLLVALDFDGTLAPLVDDPRQAQVPEHRRRLLAQVAQVFPTAIVSTRTEADILQRLTGVTVWYVVGHERRDAAPSPAVRRWRSVIEEQVRNLRGLWLEDKGHALALHFRGAGEEAQRVVAAIPALLDGARAIRGKDVLNLVPADGPHKGTHLSKLRASLGCEAVLYVGDDESDEDVFSAGPEVCGVRLGRAAHTHARYTLEDGAELDALLEGLLSLRPPRALAPERAPSAHALRAAPEQPGWAALRGRSA